MAAPVTRPYVICHMMASVDGRIAVDRWPIAAAGRALFEHVHTELQADAWMCGRVTMSEGFAASTRDVDADDPYRGPPRDDHVAAGPHAGYAIAVDGRGALRWDRADVSGDHVIVLLSAQVPDAHLASLRASGVSYLICGERELDLALAFEQLGTRFGIRTLLLEGGGAINASVLGAGLIDELSLLIAPVADTRRGRAALFDSSDGVFAPQRLSLLSVVRRDDDFLWLRYRIGGAAQ